MMTNITLYTKNNCPQCMMTKHFFNQHNIQYQEINLDTHPEYTEQLKEKGFFSLPVVVDSKQTIEISGFQPDALKALVS